MEIPLHLPVADGAAVRILQITDTHLFAGETDTLLGINTLNSYHAVLDAIAKQQLPADLIAATGDLVQDQTIRAYQRFTDGIARLPAPCVWLPGESRLSAVHGKGTGRRGDLFLQTGAAR